MEQKAHVNTRSTIMSPLMNFSLISGFVFGFALILAVLALSTIDSMTGKAGTNGTSPSGAEAIDISGKMALVQDNTRLVIRWPEQDKEYLVAAVPPTKIYDPSTHEWVENKRESIIQPTFSPKGKNLSYVRTIESYDGYLTGRAGTLWVADAEGRNAKRIASNVVFSHWSDDGEWIYCYGIPDSGTSGLADSRIWQRHHVTDGRVEVLTDSFKELDDTWLHSVASDTGNRIVVEPVTDDKFGCQVEDFKLIVSTQSGQKKIGLGSDILQVDGGRAKVLTPAWSPDGRYIAMTIYKNIYDGWEELRQWDKSVVYIYDINTGKGRVVGDLQTFLCWTPDSRGLVVPNGKTCGVVTLDGTDFTPVGPMAGAADWSSSN